MARIAKSWRLIEDVLRENSHSVYRALRKPAPPGQIQRLQGRIPAKLPHIFLESLKVHNGLRNSYLGRIRLFNFWALLPISAILDEWTNLTKLQSECAFGGNQTTDTPKLKNNAHWRPAWVPFMDADGNKLAIDLDPDRAGKTGQVFKWSNSGSNPDRVVADAFGEWLAELADVLSKRKFRLDKFGGIWLEGPGVFDC